MAGLQHTHEQTWRRCTLNRNTREALLWQGHDLPRIFEYYNQLWGGATQVEHLSHSVYKSEHEIGDMTCVYWDASTNRWAEQVREKNIRRDSMLPLDYCCVFEIHNLKERSLRAMRRASKQAIRKQQAMLREMQAKALPVELLCKILSYTNLSAQQLLRIHPAAKIPVCEANKDKLFRFKLFPSMTRPQESAGPLGLLHTLQSLNADLVKQGERKKQEGDAGEAVVSKYKVCLDISLDYWLYTWENDCAKHVLREFMLQCPRGAGVIRIHSKHCSTDLCIDNFPDLESICLELPSYKQYEDCRRFQQISCSVKIHVRACPRLISVFVRGGCLFAACLDTVSKLSITDCPRLAGLHVANAEIVEIDNCMQLQAVTIVSNRLERVSFQNTSSNLCLNWIPEPWTEHNWTLEQQALRDSLASVGMLPNSPAHSSYLSQADSGYFTDLH